MTSEAEDRARELGRITTEIQFIFEAIKGMASKSDIASLEKQINDVSSKIDNLDWKENTDKIETMWVVYKEKEGNIKTLKTRIIGNVGNIITAAITSMCFWVAAKFGIDF